MWIGILALLLCSTPVSCMHFYLKSGQTKCFYESLDKAELMAANFDLELRKADGSFFKQKDLAISITVDETFDNNHRVVDQRNVSAGPFSFSAVEKGEHRICLTPFHPDNTEEIKITHEIELGTVISLESKRNAALGYLKDRIRELNERLASVRNEQEIIKLSEARYRNDSEVTNRKAMLWSIALFVVILLTCWCQLRYLKTLLVKRKRT